MALTTPQPSSPPDEQTIPAVRAAGAVLWRRVPGGRILVALVHRPKYDDWSLPKGKLEPGEHWLAAAVREVREETGQGVTLGRPLPAQHYRVTSGSGAGRLKEVRFWAGRATGGGFTPHAEVDALAWLDVQAAATRLSRPADVETLAAFRAGPARTGTVLVLRHGQAVPRAAWSGPDADRPLRADGRAQASALVPLLAAYGPARLISSPAMRCTTTLQPLSRISGLPVEPLPGLGEDAVPAATEEAIGRLLTLAEAEPLVVCTHRPLLPTVLAGMRATDAGATQPLAPSEFVAVHLDGPATVATERHRP